MRRAVFLDSHNCISSRSSAACVVAEDSRHGLNLDVLIQSHLSTQFARAADLGESAGRGALHSYLLSRHTEQSFDGTEEKPARQLSRAGGGTVYAIRPEHGMQLDPSMFVGRTLYEFGPGAPGQLRPASRASLSSRARNRGGPHHRRGSSGRSRSRLTSSSTSSRRTRAWPEGRRLAIGSRPNLIHRSTVDRWTPTRRAASPVVSSSSSANTRSVACTAFFGLAACYECSECYDLSRAGIGCGGLAYRLT
jgi:hypothetical protein